MKVSVITVVFNDRCTIEDTISSVINQSFSSLEYICIDGCSTDGTIAFLESNKNYFSNLVIEPDLGIYDAMNKGLNLATGEWVIFMNSGDAFYDSYVLERIFSQENAFSSAGVVYGDFVIRSVVGSRIVTTNLPFFKQDAFLKSKGMCHQSVLVKTVLARRFPFDLQFKVSADFKMLYDIHKIGQAFYYLSGPVCFYNVDNGKSKQNQLLAWKEDAIVTGVSRTFRFKLNYFFIVLKYQIHIALSRFAKTFFPSLFLYIKRKRNFQ